MGHLLLFTHVRWNLRRFYTPVVTIEMVQACHWHYTKNKRLRLTHYHYMDTSLHRTLTHAGRWSEKKGCYHFKRSMCSPKPRSINFCQLWLAVVLWHFFSTCRLVFFCTRDSVSYVNLMHMLKSLSTLWPFKDCERHFTWLFLENAVHSSRLKIMRTKRWEFFFSSEIHQNRWEPYWTLLSSFAGPQSSPANQGAWLPAAIPHSSPTFNGHYQAASSYNAR